MNSVVRSPDAQTLTDVLQQIPEEDDGYGRWWSTDSGVWLHNQIGSRIANAVTWSVKQSYGVHFERGDVVNTAVAVLGEPERRDAICTAADPWAYLYVTLRREMSKQAGQYFRVQISEVDPVFIVGDVTPSFEPMLDAIKATAQLLIPLTPGPLRHALVEAVFYFAERGHSRAQNLYSIAWRDEDLSSTGFNRDQILAIANVVLGSRPDRHKTSVLGNYLRTLEWTPDLVMQKALHKYQVRMLRSLRTNPTLERTAA